MEAPVPVAYRLSQVERVPGRGEPHPAPLLALQPHELERRCVGYLARNREEEVWLAFISKCDGRSHRRTPPAVFHARQPRRVAPKFARRDCLLPCALKTSPVSISLHG